MNPNYNSVEKNASKIRKSREESTKKVIEFQSKSAEMSQRTFARETGVPRTTLQSWLTRNKQLHKQAPAATEFFETPEGLVWLHRIVLAALFVITQLGAGGIRQVCTFLKLSQLELFVASSYGSQQKMTVAMEQLIGEFGETEQNRLAQMMEPKSILACQDETFHPEICLVAIEPSSDYILYEKYAKNREAETWNKAMASAIEGLPVKIIQSTSDQAPVLLKHVKEGLGAHHSPDLFHVQQDLTKATSLPLSSRQRWAEEHYRETQEHTTQQVQSKELYENHPETRGPGRPPHFETHIELARESEKDALQWLKQTQQHKEEVKKAIKGISQSYHPFSLEEGQVREPQKVSDELEGHIEVIEAIADETELSARSHQLLKKAKRVLPQMKETLVFVHGMILVWLKALELPKEIEEYVHHRLVPSIYLEKVAGQTRDVEQRDGLRSRAKQLLKEYSDGGSPLQKLDAQQCRRVEQVAKECAWLFVRSSSCVEGRNGHLELRHRVFHRLNDRKLKSLTVLHNFFITRKDGTSAAERFFGAKPKNLFDFLVEKMELPRRSALWKKAA